MHNRDFWLKKTRASDTMSNDLTSEAFNGSRGLIPVLGLGLLIGPH
jgi:hypothetical protein